MASLPGRSLLAWASRWFDAATVSRVFEPLVADWQREWVESRAARRPWIRAHGTLAFARSAIGCAPDMLLAPVPQVLARRVLSRIIIVTGVLTGLMAIPFILDLGSKVPVLRHATLLVLLLPSLIVIAFPFAIMSAADALRRHRQPSPIERAAAMRLAGISLLLMLAFGGWLVPAANQQLKVVTAVDAAHIPPRGVRELSIAELAADSTHRADAVRREIATRAAFVLLPAVLLWARWRSYDIRRDRVFTVLPIGVAIPAVLAGILLLFWNDRAIEEALRLAPGLGRLLLLLIMPGLLLAEYCLDRFTQRVEAR